MSSILSWQLPSPEPRLAARRYLVRRRDCLQPIRTAVFQHPDLAPMIRALMAKCSRLQGSFTRLKYTIRKTRPPPSEETETYRDASRQITNPERSE